MPEPPPPLGAPARATPHDRLLPSSLEADERALLLPDHEPALYAVADAAEHLHLERKPVVLVHGYGGAPADFVHVAARLRRHGDLQPYVLCYDSTGRRTALNGDGLADELRALPRFIGHRVDLTIVAHSMGGVVAQRALNQLIAGDRRGVERFRSVHLIAADTPWHGFPGPSDRGAAGAFMDLARGLIPDGLEDMRARSALYQGDPSSTDPVDSRGLCDIELPDPVTVELVFAEEGLDICDYSEGFLRGLPAMLANHYTNDASIRGEPRLMNFWKALLLSSAYYPFANELRDLADARRLDAAAVLAALLRYYPRFPGDHDGVLREQPGRRSFLDFLDERLGC